METIDVFADVGCPFAHAGLVRFAAFRRQRGAEEPILRVRAWPLEWVNGKSHDGTTLTAKIEALRADVTPDLFAGFDEDRFPPTTIPAMISEAAAYRTGIHVGERFSLAVRRALFDDGLDVCDDDVLRGLRVANGVSDPASSDKAEVDQNFAEGKLRGVDGSPHFFTSSGSFFCPSLTIEHEGSNYDVSFDAATFQRFVEAAFD